MMGRYSWATVFSSVSGLTVGFMIMGYFSWSKVLQEYEDIKVKIQALDLSNE